MSKMNLEVKITKSFEAEECTGEFFDVNDEIWKFYGVYRLSDKLYSFVEKTLIFSKSYACASFTAP